MSLSNKIEKNSFYLNIIPFSIKIKARFVMWAKAFRSIYDSIYRCESNDNEIEIRLVLPIQFRCGKQMKVKRSSMIVWILMWRGNFNEDTLTDLPIIKVSISLCARLYVHIPHYLFLCHEHRLYKTSQQFM